MISFSQYFHLISEITINLNNSYKWYTLTPSQVNEKFPDRGNEFLKVFSFQISNYEYIAIYTKSGEFHFINYTDAMSNETGETDNTLNILKSEELMKLAATLFSIIQYMTKYVNSFIIIPPNNDVSGIRGKIYLKLISSNYKHFLPNYEIQLSNNSDAILLYNTTPHKEVIPEMNMTFIENIVNQFNKKY